ncbi:MAG: threonine/serine exporter family protein [Pseudonocardia sp.]|nr:threonine/serine exporter family protein [Pseudonocardia sp.]
MVDGNGEPRVRLTKRVRHALGREARALVQPGPPSLELMLPVGPQVPDDAQVQQALDLCMRTGEVLLSSGESASDTTNAMIELANACGLPMVDVDITFTSITMCCHRGMAASPVTSMRLVRRRSLDLTRQAAVRDIMARVARGALDVRGAATELDVAVRSRHPYPRWVATAGWAGLAAGIALMLGAAPSTAMAAFVVTGAVDRTGRLLSRWGVPSFFQQVVGGALATGAAIGLFATGLFPAGTRPSLVVAAGITVLLSGLSVVGTVQDAIAGYYVTAAGRAAEIALLSAGLLTGVVLALKVGAEFGLLLTVTGEVPAAGGRYWSGIGGAAVAAAGFALAGYAQWRPLLMAALAGAAGWATYGLMTQFATIGPVAATGAAAIVVGGVAGLLRRGTAVQPLVVVLAGITPLLPGFVAYRGFYELAVEGVADGLVTVTVALAIGLALAAGASFGEFLTAPHHTGTPARAQ